MFIARRQHQTESASNVLLDHHESPLIHARSADELMDKTRGCGLCNSSTQAHKGWVHTKNVWKLEQNMVLPQIFLQVQQSSISN